MSAADDQAERPPLGVLPYVIAGILLLFGPALAGLTGYASISATKFPSARAVSGEVTCDELTDVPFGERACFARVTVNGSSGNVRGSNFSRLMREDVGSAKVALDGVATTLPTRTLENSWTSRWYGCPAEYERVRDVSALPVARDVREKFNFYNVSSWPVRAGDRVTVDLDEQGRPNAMWCKDPKALAKLDEKSNKRAFWLFGGLAAGSFLVGLLVLRFIAGRRRERAS